MIPYRIIWLFCGVLVLAGLALGYHAYTTPRAATVIVEWSTASELDTAGFNLYRSDTPAGPFTRVNEELIPASPDPLIGGSYRFTDTNVVAGHTYYYQLEDVEINGTTTRHGPIEVRAAGSKSMAFAVAVALIGAATVLSLLARGVLVARQR